MIWKVAALYKFTRLSDINSLRPQLKAQMLAHGVVGSLLIADEGINGTIAAKAVELDKFLLKLQSHHEIGALEVKYSTASVQPFKKTKVRLKQEIVRLKQPHVDPTKDVGTYVEGQEWNDIISDPDTIVIDTRNDYEVDMGTFKGAIDPKTKEFHEFPNFVKSLDAAKHQKIAMFCTGGIRCEKASSYMLAEGFKQVYHLKGGILKYLEDMPEDKSLWEGECFVFDERVSVKHGLIQGDHIMCYGCGEFMHKEMITHPDYKEGIHCHLCKDDLTPEQLKSREDQHAHYSRINKSA